MRRSVLIILAPLVTVVLVVSALWITDKKFWYFRGYEFYSDWVYTGLSEPNVVMRESGDSAREYLVDRQSSQNSISLNEFGHRVSPCSNPTVLGLGDSQLFGSGVDDRETFPFQVFRNGGPCIYNAGRHNTLESFQIPGLNVHTVLITSTERDGFRWYCDLPPESWDLEKKSKSELILKRVTAPRLALSTAIRRTISVVRLKTQNLLALRIVAPSARLIKFEHRVSPGELEKDLTCAIRVDKFLREKGFETAFLLFPSAQTLNPDSVQREIDDQTLNFITNLTGALTAQGLKTVDSKKCLDSNGNKYVQLHDTHLSPLGMEKLARCVIAAKVLETNHDD